jgi:predicted Zn-dependent protease
MSASWSASWSARPTRWLAGVALALLLGACASSPDNKTVSLELPQFTLPNSPGQPARPTAEQRENARILATYSGVYDDAKVHAMVTQLVDRLVAASEMPEQKFEVTILNSPAVNAFALPNGQLYITRGLLALANDKAELASVLAHEMGHVIARHAAIREDQARQAALVSHVVSDVLSDPQVGALALAKSKLALASFSRAQEFEADGIGVGISARAGFDPYGASRFLTDMQRNAELKAAANGELHASSDFLSNHPATPDRVRNALANARQFSSPGSGERDRNEYLRVLDGVVYGEDPSEGFVRGRKFLHPKLGFTFTAPAGFSLDNTAQAVLGLKDGGGEAMRLDVVSVPAEQTLPDYLKSGWMDNVEAQSVEEFSINGFPAATATAKGEQWSFRLFAVRFGSDVYRFIFAAKTMTAQADHSFRDSVMTFRRMSLKESNEVKPLRIKAVTVGKADTVASLTHRMQVNDHALDRFRLLNGLGPHDRVKPGEVVKLVE